MRANTALSAWRANRQTIGAWLSLANTHTAETMASLGPQAQSAEVSAAALATLKTLYTEGAIQIPGL